MICTICGSHAHVAASCPQRPRPVDRLIALAAILMLVFGWAAGARAHEWYDPDCCGGNDCEPVSHVSFVAADARSTPTMVVTTSLGTKPLTEATKVRSSKDGRMHACIYMGRLLCLYLPPGQ